MVTIIPAILATTKDDFSQQLEHIKGSADLAEGWLHIDFMDGQLVDTTSIPVTALEGFEIPYQKEAHLMVVHPQQWIESLKAANFKRVIIHVEAEDISETIQHIKQAGMQAGLAIDPDTPLAALEPFLSEVEVVLVMAIQPGKQGQPFLSTSYDRVKEVRTFFETVAVDGGVSDQTAAGLIEAGASRLVIGSYLQKGDIDESLEKIWEIVG